MEREQLGPTGCETRTSTTDERKSHTANLSTSIHHGKWSLNFQVQKKREEETMQVSHQTKTGAKTLDEGL